MSKKSRVLLGFCNWLFCSFGFGCGCCGGSRGVSVRGGGCLSGFGRRGIWGVVEGWADLADGDGAWIYKYYRHSSEEIGIGIVIDIQLFRLDSTLAMPCHAVE
jgi:hypothetical protein